nr:HNH endonuclease signature motif containing protein [Actinopolymorpha rutila]
MSDCNASAATFTAVTDAPVSASTPVARIPRPAAPDETCTGGRQSPPTSTSATSSVTTGASTAGRGAPRSLEGLEAEICDLASRIAIATHEWLRLIVAFDRREGWRTSGCRSTAQWLSWRCGMSLSAAYEHLRVGRALEGLPKIAAEFAAGRLSYSKVRALTRIAGADHRPSHADRDTTRDETTQPSPRSGRSDNPNARAEEPTKAQEPPGAEAHADAQERSGTVEGGAREGASHMGAEWYEDADTAGAEADANGEAYADSHADAGDTDADAGDAGAEGDTDAEDELLNLARSATAAQLDRIARGCSAARSKEQNHRRAMRRGVTWFYDEDGSLVIRGRLAPDEGATVVAALEAALDTLLARKSAPPPTTKPPASPASPAPPASPTASGPTAGATEPSGTTDSAKPTGITGTAEPTGVTDMPDSASRDDTTASAEACYPSAPDGPRSDGPRSDSSAEESRSGQTAASAVPPSDTPPAVPHRHRGALAADALVLMAETLLANTPAFLNSADKYRVIVHLNPAAGPGMFTPAAAIPSADEGTPRPAPHQAAHLDDGIPLAPETADRLACEATVTNLHIGGDGQVHGLGDPTRFPRAATARAVRIRAHHACQAPGCTTRHGLQIHHVRHWCHGGETSLANLVLICRFHHWLVHEGGHTFAARPGATFGFYRPDGTEVPATPSLPGITGAPADRPVDAHFRGSGDAHNPSGTGNSYDPSGSGNSHDPSGTISDRNLARSVLDRWVDLRRALGEDVLTPPWWSGDPLDLDYAVSVILDAQAALN